MKIIVKTHFLYFGVKLLCLSSSESMSVYSCCRAKQRDRENIQAKNGRVFASGGATIDKEGIRLGEGAGVGEGSEGGVGVR